MTVKEYNEKAFQALRDLDFLTAQTLFRNNRKENPGFVSSQNLGAFYLHNGMDLSNGKTRSAIKDGIRLFQEALQYKSDAAISYAALGAAYADLAFFRHGEYADAEKAYRKAISLEENWKRWYSLGAIRNEFGDYEEAASCFQKALSLCDGDQEDKTNTYMCSAFCIVQYDKDEAYKLLCKILSFPFPEYNVMNLFILAYYCKKYALALEILEVMLKTTRWALGLSAFKMVMVCCFKTENEIKAKEYLDYWIEYKKQFDYNVVPEIRAAKKAYLDNEYRNQFIHEHREHFSIGKEDYYVE